MTKTYELPKKMIIADVDEKHHTATVSVYVLDELVEAVNKNNMLDKIRAIAIKWQTDTWTDNLSHECMCEIADIVAEREDKE